MKELWPIPPSHLPAFLIRETTTLVLLTRFSLVWLYYLTLQRYENRQRVGHDPLHTQGQEVGEEGLTWPDLTTRTERKNLARHDLFTAIKPEPPTHFTRSRLFALPNASLPPSPRSAKEIRASLTRDPIL
ncbi:hypothetical protein Pcinc_002951 [Petrolisthes cinctipes]|uniref:Uncharacterized protein n=1 Tax=Petrolisthes cinctipes TaxID=88211 RepID=A0AAE1GJZ6_PETCI|nr:hypothetical protein Pcinc_002951 [Petrolisthes cinctipes]